MAPNHQRTADLVRQARQFAETQTHYKYPRRRRTDIFRPVQPAQLTDATSGAEITC